ncbi:MAG: PDZ domain-containing protein, partial [Anaerolineae bacterium]|nr:PDZ domain-containing protein [Anaerolineae bacterium]
IALPIEPQGSLRDVDQDGGEDTGVIVFAIAYWDNTWGDPFLEERDQSGGGWSTAYASTRISDDPEQLREVVGGKYLIYAPDDEQNFPEGFGADGLLFTEDDPIVSIPQGYSVVNLDVSPFEFDRSRQQIIDLIEPESSALTDFSDLSFTEAFDAMIDKMRREYAFTEYKGINWDAISAKYRDRFVQADANDDERLYLDTLGEIIWGLPDGHINIGPFGAYRDEFFRRVGNGIGLSIRETDDQHAYAVFVAEGSPADDEGIQVGAEILAINGIPIADYISRVRPYTETFSTPHNRRLGQERYATRFADDVTSVEVTYQNQGDDEPTTVSVDTLQEFDSYLFSFGASPQSGFELPVEYEILPSGYVIASITSFFDNRVLTVQLWERMIQQVKEQDVPGLIIDMRENGGGNGFLADQLTAYFFNEPLIVGYRGEYSKELDEFFFDPRGVQQLYLPAEDLRYDGPVVVLVGPDCASACERFAYNLTLQDRAAIIGYYPTAGLGGGVEDFVMPLDMTIRFTVSRSVDPDGNIHIESNGVAPTIKVPVTRESLFATGDPVLETAIDYLNDAN